MSHSITSRRGACDARAGAQADRVAAGAQARAQRAPHVDARAVAAALVAARAPQRRRELEARHQPVELRQLVRLERVEALAGQQLLVAGHRQRHLDLARRRPPRRPRRGGAEELIAASCRSARRALVERWCSGVGATVERPRNPRLRASSERRRAPPNTEKKTASNAVTCAGSDDRHRARRPVQPPAGRSAPRA